MKSRRVVAIVIGLVAIPMLAWAGAVGYLVLKPHVANYVHSTRFESAGWKARSSDDGVMWPTRLRMVDDLLTRNLLVGRSRAQVEELLGPTDDTPYFREWNLVYHLGPERRSFGIDSEWLVVRLDGAGRAAEWRLVRD